MLYFVGDGETVYVSIKDNYSEKSWTEISEEHFEDIIDKNTPATAENSNMKLDDILKKLNVLEQKVEYIKNIKEFVDLAREAEDAGMELSDYLLTSADDTQVM